MVVIAEFSQLVKADLAKAQLEAEGIRVVLLDANTISVNPFYSPALGGVKLAVADEDAARAREILGLTAE